MDKIVFEVVQKFNNRNDKCYIAKLAAPDEQYVYKREFVKRKDLHYKSRQNDTKDNGQDYIYEYTIDKTGVYEFSKIDLINDKEKWDKRCAAFVDVENNMVEIIKYDDIKKYWEKMGLKF